jgi:hypothetical protein
MSERNPTMFSDPQREAHAIEVLEKAQNLPPGKERTNALRQARQLRNAAVTLGRFLTMRVRAGKMGRYWTEEDIANLMPLAQQYPLPILPEKIDRTVGGVFKVYKLKS